MKLAKICFIKKFNVDKAFTNIKIFREKVKLFDQLFTLNTIFFEFIDHIRHEIDEHNKNNY